MASTSQTHSSASTSRSYPTLNQSQPYDLRLGAGPDSIPPTTNKRSDWDDEIVPALRRKLESQSQTLGKRLSRVQGNDNWNSGSGVGGGGISRRDEMDNRFIDQDENIMGMAIINGNENGNKRKKSIRREREEAGASQSNAISIPGSSSLQNGNRNDSYMDSYTSSKKVGRKTEPYQTTTSRNGLGHGQPSTSNSRYQSNRQDFNRDQEMDIDVGNQTFPTIQSNQEIYDPEEEPAGAEARKEYRIRTQSQPLAVRNSAAKDRARKIQLERERNGESNSGRERDYPPSSSRKAYPNQEEIGGSNSTSSRGPRKVPSLGDTRSSIQNSTSPISSYSKIPRPVRRDSVNSRHSVRSERSERSLRLQTVTGTGGASQLNGIKNGQNKASYSSDSDNQLSPPSSPIQNNSNLLNQITPNNSKFNSTSNHLKSNGLSRTDSRKAARTPTKEQLEEFGPLGGGERLGTSKKFGTAPSGLSSMILDSNSNSRNGKSSKGSTNNSNPSSNNRLTPNQMNEMLSQDPSYLSSSSSDSNLRLSKEDIRSNFYTTQQAKKWDDQLLPVVAKRLQAEAMRNARMSQFEGLVDTWDVNGLPLSYKNWNNEENDKKIESLLKEEEELKRGKEEELKLLEEKERRRLMEEEERKRKSSQANRDRNNEIEMMRLEHQGNQTQIRRSEEGAKKLVEDHQVNVANQKRKEEKKKNDAGCCQCAIM